MKTLAIWYEAKNKVKDATIEIHINFFKLKRNRSILRKYDYILELGFMIYDITDISKMNIHFPFDVKVEDLKDIGSLLSDKKLTDSIFNEYYNVSTNLPKQISVKKMDGNVAFTIYEIDFDNEEKGSSHGDFTLCKKYRGTLLSLNLKNIPERQEGKSYIRFRLKINNWQDFIVNHNPTNWFLQSAFTIIESLDFRVNEERSYNSSLAESIHGANKFKINKISFFLIREATDDIAFSSIPFSCRGMEDNWSKYLDENTKGNSFNLKKMIIYQLTSEKDREIEHFNVFVKIKVRKCNWKTIGIYIVFFGFLSIFFDILYYRLPDDPISFFCDLLCKLKNLFLSIIVFIR